MKNKLVMLVVILVMVLSFSSGVFAADFTDTEHKKFFWSENVVNFAIENGWYTPAVEGDYSDFDYTAAYQGENSDVKSNWDRSDISFLGSMKFLA